MDPSLHEFFEMVLARIEQHPRYAVLLRNAVAAQEALVLNYHCHAKGEPYCVSVGVYDGALPLMRIPGEYRELAHIRGIGREAADCEPLMGVFAELLQSRFALRSRPTIELDGRPLAQGGGDA